MSKAPIFAFLIAAIGCLEGFKVSGSAESVGSHTTSSVVQSIFNLKLIEFGGDIAVAVSGIVHSVVMMILMAVISMNMASQPIIGFNHGAERPDRVWKTLKLGLFWATVVVTAGFVIIEIFPESIIMLFNTDNPELIKIGSHGISIMLCMLPVVGLQIITSNYFQSTGRARVATILTLFRQVVWLMPLLLILPEFFGLDGIWMAMPVSDLITSIITVLVLVPDVKRLRSSAAEKLL